MAKLLALVSLLVAVGCGASPGGSTPADEGGAGGEAAGTASEAVEPPTPLCCYTAGNACTCWYATDYNAAGVCAEPYDPHWQRRATCADWPWHDG